MSAMTALRAPSRRPETAPQERPALYVVRGFAPARSTVPFIMVIVLILAGALAASMLLNASMAATAFRMQSTEVELNVVNDHIVTVRSQVEDASAASSLTKRAAELGMVPAAAPGVIDLGASHLSAGQVATAR